MNWNLPEAAKQVPKKSRSEEAEEHMARVMRAATTRLDKKIFDGPEMESGTASANLAMTFTAGTTGENYSNYSSRERTGSTSYTAADVMKKK